MLCTQTMHWNYPWQWRWYFAHRGSPAMIFYIFDGAPRPPIPIRAIFHEESRYLCSMVLKRRLQSWQSWIHSLRLPSVSSIGWHWFCYCSARGSFPGVLEIPRRWNDGHSYQPGGSSIQKMYVRKMMNQSMIHFHCWINELCFRIIGFSAPFLCLRNEKKNLSLRTHIFSLNSSNQSEKNSTLFRLRLFLLGVFAVFACITLVRTIF